MTAPLLLKDKTAGGGGWMEPVLLVLVAALIVVLGRHVLPVILSVDRERGD